MFRLEYNYHRSRRSSAAVTHNKTIRVCVFTWNRHAAALGKYFLNVHKVLGPTRPCPCDALTNIVRQQRRLAPIDFLMCPKWWRRPLPIMSLSQNYYYNIACRLLRHVNDDDSPQRVIIFIIIIVIVRVRYVTTAQRTLFQKI